MKTAFLLSIAFGIVTVVSVFMVWSVLSAAGVWDSINPTVQDIVGGQDASSFDVEDYLGTCRVLGFTMLVAAVDVVLLTAIATLARSSTTWPPRCSAASRSPWPRTTDAAIGRLAAPFCGPSRR